MPLGRIVSPNSRFVCRGCSRSLTPASRRAYSAAAGTTAAPAHDIYDVVCVGGGPAGLSLLTALRANPVTANLRVALVEAQDLSKVASFSLPPTQYSNRCSSLTPSSAHFLNEIGAWKHMQRDRIQAFQEMQVWDGVTGARIEFDWQHRGGGEGSTLAYMTENLNTTSGLMKRLNELGGVTMLDKSRVESITLGEETEDLDLSGWPVVHLSGGQSLAARLLVGADGANSPVRSFAGIESRGWDYGRHGVVATLELEGEGWGGAHTKTAYQRFLPTGPVAMLPMPGRYATLVWSTTPENAAVLRALPVQDLVALVNAAFRLPPVDIAYMHTQTAGGQQAELAWRTQHTEFDARATPQAAVAVQDGSVASFPLKLRHADTYVGERVALVGDAAHTIHPLAGQGLNQGQGDIQSLARAIRYAVEHGQDLGTQMALEPYNGERYAANHVILGVCDKLHKLYSVESGPLVPLRSLGLRAVNGLSSLKGFLMDQASGTGAKVF
ncbi:ubiquinone biosynthesis monooxygenase COQ6 [Akanthomyces lecanii RCEF 1005]|uniref:Ubiquinone biosynthesis monooxygenase COQ6, mitochondrial n=1 Tax=Akanthomyces lecanii RCEF 1005 TaxID=1081108 RepID=A0A168HMB0_CORDF|nr:ubiquinone biosynthesis monooxygenase COQ6 [Akanthomyces lecanii RCEF 1005]